MSILAFIIGIAILAAYLGLIACLTICIAELKERMRSILSRIAFYVSIFGLILFGGFIYCVYYNISAIVNENEEWRKKRDIALMISY